MIMKKIATFLLLTFTAVNFLFSQNTQDSRSLEPFNKIRVTGKINTYVSNDTSFTAKITTDGIDLADITTQVVDSTLTVKPSKGIHRDYSVDLYLSCGQIVDAYVKSGGRISFQDTLVAPSATFTAGLNSSIDASVQLNSVEVASKNGGTVNLSGKAIQIKARVRTGGTLSALQLATDTAYVSVRTKGLAKVNVSQLIDGSIRSAGSLTLAGNPASKKIQTGVGATLIEQ